MLTVSELTKSYSGRILFDNVNVQFDPGNRYGLTGANGAGKSTFMKVLSGDVESDSGQVSIPPRARMSVLHQDHYKYADAKVRDVVIMGNPRLWTAMSAKNALLAKLDEGAEFDDAMGMELAEHEVVISEEDGYDAESEAERLLHGLGFEATDYESTLAEIQGGMRLRVLLAQALFGNPDILLLDEPTNHLDLESIGWLEQFLLNYKGVLVVISHDRHFLNEVCTHTADVDYESIILYHGGYDEMMSQKVKARAQVEKANASKQKKVEDLQDFIRRFGANAKKASQAQSRRKMLDKIDIADLKRSNIARPFIRFDYDEPSGKIALELKNLGHSYGDHEVLRNINLVLQRGEKLAVVGPNGIGKSTLLKAIAGELEPSRGSVRHGHMVRMGYLPQNHEEGLGARKHVNAYEWLHQWDEKATVQEVRGVLGRMLFPSQEAEKQVGVLSGGETVRLLLSKLTLTKPNVLVLDEPTNHLDLESIRALTEALQKYEGAMVFVAHDRALISEVATCVLELKHDCAHEHFPGGYDEYLVHTGRETAADTSL